MGFLQIGGGLAGSLIAALFFTDAFQALINVLPFLALMGALLYALLSGVARRKQRAIAVEPTGASEPGEEEIESLVQPVGRKSP
jgi:predicted lipid-binding transport protein (Tim44 family)